jgi:coniferyl-aldehyde dehydrogenase
MSEAEAKQIERMKSLLGVQQDAFRHERHRPIDLRKADLARIADMCRKNADAINEAISRDFGNRAAQESIIAELARRADDADAGQGHRSP